MADRAESEARRARLLLLLGAAAGLTAAAAGLITGVGRSSAPPAAGEIARVNGAGIPREQLQRTLGALARDKRNALTPQDERHVLDRLIEEELLVQRGVEVGLVDSDARIRKAMVAAMIQSIVADVESRQAEPGEVERFFEENRGYFASPPRFRLERLSFRAADSREPPAERARDARAALAVESVAKIRQEWADEPVLSLPDALLPPHKLREYLGPAVVEAALALEDGAWSAPIETPQGWQLVRVVERSEPAPPAFEDVFAQVESEFRRRAGDRALREYLEWLRSEADVVLAPDAPQ
ncbi:MAG: peptidylprolyl isomerase [Myxococcales bacterium]|nr:peptidylprolyl isomerase [Myxococcales bacterium]